MKIPNYYIIELTESYNSQGNDRKYHKCERLIAWDVGMQYDVCNNNGDAIPKSCCKIIHKLNTEVANETTNN